MLIQLGREHKPQFEEVMLPDFFGDNSRKKDESAYHRCRAGADKNGGKKWLF